VNQNRGKFKEKFQLSKLCISAIDGYRKVKFYVPHFLSLQILSESGMIMKILALKCVG
jgi:hypothetical protein